MAFLIFNWLAGAAAWFWLIRRYDRIDPEPYRAMLSVGILGGLVSGLVAVEIMTLFESVVLGMTEGWMTAVVNETVTITELIILALETGLIEESCKALATIYFAKRLGEVDEPVDAVLYAMLVGLGFAVIENLNYAIDHGNSTLLWRNIFCIPGHVGYALLWGCGLAKARFAKPDRPVLVIIAPTLLIAALLHAGYDYIAFTASNTTITVYAVIQLIALLWFAHTRLKALGRESPHLAPGECSACRAKNPGGSQYCSACGESLAQKFYDICVSCSERMPAYAHYCPNCGTETEQVG